ncbi:hypothetical protein OTU49_005239 [Cherax quadricarinatus]|uniref:Acyl-coenzyme A oxidase N-terminal domain-containing protein n=1 Tax=Cherax quadricarinatus TaxID=27406 RepID=A0AAW0X8Q7_CHEQU
MDKNNERECNEDLIRERRKCNFNIEELTNIVDGGKARTARRREIQRLLINDPEFLDEIPQDYMSHEDRYSNELRKSAHLMQKLADQESGHDIRSWDTERL